VLHCAVDSVAVRVATLTVRCLVVQVAVADRTALILDIFSQRAQTREGKLQVRLHAGILRSSMQPAILHQCAHSSYTSHHDLIQTGFPELHNKAVTGMLQLQEHVIHWHDGHCHSHIMGSAFVVYSSILHPLPDTYVALSNA
jgi:hypothetical protein